MEDFYTKFLGDVHYMRWEEWVSAIAQLFSVWYARKNNILVFPTGIIGVLLAAYVYFYLATPPLYADGVLNVYYFIMSVYGWYNWSKTDLSSELLYKISWCTKSELLLGLGGFVFGWIVIFLLLSVLTDSNTPILDSLVSASAFTAMWWMAKRKIENWLAWIFSNVVAIPLNIYKGFIVFTVMYIIFLYLSYLGYKHWIKLKS